RALPSRPARSTDGRALVVALLFRVKILRPAYTALLYEFHDAIGSRGLFSPLVFFFSSRRRHTRSKRDWSSDVCSSDLLTALLLFYMSGLISALASSLAIIGVVIALAVPFLESGDVHVGGFVAALAIAATIVDISP